MIERNFNNFSLTTSFSFSNIPKFQNSDQSTGCLFYVGSCD